MDFSNSNSLLPTSKLVDLQFYILFAAYIHIQFKFWKRKLIQNAFSVQFKWYTILTAMNVGKFDRITE